MIGFFEHQYLRYKKNHIKNLLALAKVDGHMHEEEVRLLYRISRDLGLKDAQVQRLMESDEKYELNVPDNHHDKMNLLYDLILMVYADGVIDKHEIDFCAEAVKHFGMKKELLAYLLDVFEKGTPPPFDEWEEIKKVAEEKFRL